MDCLSACQMRIWAAQTHSWQDHEALKYKAHGLSTECWPARQSLSDSNEFEVCSRAIHGQLCSCRNVPQTYLSSETIRRRLVSVVYFSHFSFDLNYPSKGIIILRDLALTFLSFIIHFVKHWNKTMVYLSRILCPAYDLLIWVLLAFYNS